MEGYPVTSGQQFSLLFDESKPPWDFTVVRQGELGPLYFSVKGGRGKDFREDPGDPFFYYLRARWDAAEKPQQAIRDYSRAIELEPGFDLAYIYRGHLYEEAGEREAARRDYLTALEMTPDLGEAHAYYAYFLDVEDASAARQHIQAAVELTGCVGAFEGFNIDCAEDYLLLGSLMMHDPPQMAGIAEQGIRFYEGFADNFFNAMCAYSLQGNRQRASEYARRYLDFPREDKEADRNAIAEQIIDGAGSCV